MAPALRLSLQVSVDAQERTDGAVTAYVMAAARMIGPLSVATLERSAHEPAANGVKLAEGMRSRHRDFMVNEARRWVPPAVRTAGNPTRVRMKGHRPGLAPARRLH